MYRVLAVSIYIIFVVGINGASIESPTSIDENAIELTQLIVKALSKMPDILRKTEPFAYCQVIDKCCGDEDRSKVMSLLEDRHGRNNRFRFHEIMKTCMKTNTSPKTEQFCSSFEQSIILTHTVSEDPEVEQYGIKISKHSNELRSMLHHIISTCNGEQIHAVFCTSNNKLLETCFGSILQEIYDENGDEFYQQDYTAIKQALIDLD